MSEEREVRQKRKKSYCDRDRETNEVKKKPMKSETNEVK